MNLWSDISTLTKEQFVAALGQLEEKVGPKPAARATKAKSASKAKAKLDTPAARIVALAGGSSVLERDLQRNLVTVLLQRGYPQDDFPKAADKSFEAWLEELMRRVPSADVMEAATSLVPKT